MGKKIETDSISLPDSCLSRRADGMIFPDRNAPRRQARRKELKMHLERTDDFEMIRDRYISVASDTRDISRYARWIYGKHPTDETLRTYIANGEMYVLTDGGKTAGMAAVVMSQGKDYESVSWERKLENDRVATIHLLAVCPEYQGKHLGGRLLEEIARLAARNGKEAIRLDVLESNLPARRMYEKAGYSYRGKQRLYAENTGWTDFLFYEKALDHPASEEEKK